MSNGNVNMFVCVIVYARKLICESVFDRVIISVCMNRNVSMSACEHESE